MKKIWVLTFIVSAVTSTIVYAGGYSFHDGVYRGEKWEFDFGKPKKNYITIIPKDIPEPRVHGNGYIVRDTSPDESEVFIMNKNLTKMVFYFG